MPFDDTFDTFDDTFDTFDEKTDNLQIISH